MSQSGAIVVCCLLGCSCLNSQTCKYFPSCSGLPRTKMRDSLQKVQCVCARQPESPWQLGWALLHWSHPRSACSSQPGLAGLGSAWQVWAPPAHSPALMCRCLTLPLPTHTQTGLLSVVLKNCSLVNLRKPPTIPA